MIKSNVPRMSFRRPQSCAMFRFSKGEICVLQKLSAAPRSALRHAETSHRKTLACSCSGHCGSNYAVTGGCECSSHCGTNYSKGAVENTPRKQAQICS